MTESQTTAIHATGLMHPEKIASVVVVARDIHIGGKTCPAHEKLCRDCGKQNNYETVRRSKSSIKTNPPKDRKHGVQNLVNEKSSLEETDDIAYSFPINSTSKEQSQPMFQIIVH